MSGAPRAVLWDMDGTLVDSGRLHYDAWNDLLAGMPTVGVLSTHAALDADVVVASIEGLDAATFDRLVPPA